MGSSYHLNVPEWAHNQPLVVFDFILKFYSNERRELKNNGAI